MPRVKAHRQNYAGLDSGPVKVISTNGLPIISAIRSAWAVNGVTTSFSQLMGLPLEQLSDTYVFPGYNNVTLNDQLRIANVDTVPTTVTVTIGGTLRGTYPLAAGAAVRINYPGLDSGPVVVQGHERGQDHLLHPRSLGGERGHHQLCAVDGFARWTALE